MNVKQPWILFGSMKLGSETTFRKLSKLLLNVPIEKVFVNWVVVVVNENACTM